MSEDTADGIAISLASIGGHQAVSLITETPPSWTGVAVGFIGWLVLAWIAEKAAIRSRSQGETK